MAITKLQHRDDIPPLKVSRQRSGGKTGLIDAGGMIISSAGIWGQDAPPKILWSQTHCFFYDQFYCFVGSLCDSASSRVDLGCALRQTSINCAVSTSV